MVDVAQTVLRWFRRPASLFKDTVLAYRAVFGSPDAHKHVLPDLAEFCGAIAPLPASHDQMLLAAGRREVWLHIQGFLNLSDADVYAILRMQSHVKQRREAMS